MFWFVIGERSEPSLGRWMENFVLPFMPVYGIYVCVCVPYVITWRVHGKLYGLNF